MMRTRLLWFTLGFGVSTAAISQLVLKDLWVDRQFLNTHLKQKFDALESRVSSLEHVVPDNPNPTQE